MIMRIFRIAVIIALQIVLFVIVNDVGWDVGMRLVDHPKKEFQWGLNLRFSFYIFIIIAVLGTIISDIYIRKIKKIHLFVFVSSSIIYSLVFINSFGTNPYKTLLLFVAGLFPFSVALVLYKLKYFRHMKLERKTSD
jgi:hypothetical protein